MRKTTKENLKWALIGAVISLIIGAIADYTWNEVNKKVGVNVFLDSVLKQGVNVTYLPLMVENTGDFDLHNISIYMSTCDMVNNSELYSLDHLIAHSSQELQFANPETLENFSLRDCSPSSYINGIGRKPAGNFTFSINMKEPENYTMITCGLCYYNVYFLSDKLNTSFTGQSFVSPVTETWTIYPPTISK